MSDILKYFKNKSQCRSSVVASTPGDKSSRLNRPFRVKFTGSTRKMLISFYYKQKPGKLYPNI